MCEQCVKYTNSITAKSAGLMPGRMCELERLDVSEKMFLFGKLLEFWETEASDAIDGDELREFQMQIQYCAVTVKATKKTDELDDEKTADSVLEMVMDENVSPEELSKRLDEMLKKRGGLGDILNRGRQTAENGVCMLLDKTKKRYGDDFKFEIEGSNPVDIFEQLKYTAADWYRECEKKRDENRGMDVRGWKL